MQYVGTARHGAYQNGIAYSGSVGTTTALGSQTYKAYIVVTTDAYVTTDGTTPSSSNGTYIVGLQPIYLTVTPGQTVKAIQVSSAGTLNVAECL